MKKLIAKLTNPPWRRFATAIVLIALAVLLAKQVTHRPQASIWTWFFGSSASSVSSTPATNGCSPDMDSDNDGIVDSQDPDCTGVTDDSTSSTENIAGCSSDMDSDNDGIVDSQDPDCTGVTE